MSRQRYNGLSATLGAPLAAGATTITLNGPLTHAAGDVPTLAAGDYIPMSLLDGDGEVVEIIHLTAYTLGESTATASRGEEGTTDQAHATDAALLNGPTTADFAAAALFVDIREHGADTAAADNTAAIQAAADAAAGGVLVIPKGTWITDPISLSTDTTVHLYGTLQLRAQDAATLPASSGVLYAYGTTGAHLSNVHIVGFGGKIDGNKDGITGAPTLDTECINFKYVDHGSVIGVEVFDAYDSGIDLDHSSNCIVRGNYAHDCGGWGVHMSNGAVDNLVEGNTATSNGVTHSRGGIDQHVGTDPDANRNRYIGNRADGNYRNYRIEGVYALFEGNVSLNGTNPDIITADLTTLDPTGGAGLPTDLVYKPDPLTTLTAVAGGATIDAEARSAIAEIQAVLESLGVVSGPAAPALPVTSGLVLHLEADSLVVVDGATVDTWTDQGPGANHATQATPASQPTFRDAVLNGLPAVEFDGVDDVLLLPDSTVPSGDSDYTIIAVAKFDDFTIPRTLVHGGETSSASQKLFFRSKPGGVLNDGWHSSNIESASGALTVATWHMVSTTYDGAARTMRIDQTQVATGAASGRNSGTGRNLIGNEWDGVAGNYGTPWMDGQIAELIVYNTSLSTTDRDAVEDYLATKYAL